MQINKYKDYDIVRDDPIIDAARSVGVGWIARRDSNLTVEVVALSDGWYVVDVWGWVHYSRKYGFSYTKRRALVRWDTDNNRWLAFRVPPGNGPDYLMPAEVSKGKREGRFIDRQGDVWVLKAKGNRSSIKGELGNHEIKDGVLTHPEHRPVILPPKYRLIVGVITSTHGRRAD